MKRLFIFLVLCTISTYVHCQTPEKISYQAIIRDTNNNLVTDSDVSLMINIRQYTFDGNSVFSETHLASTNANGLISLEIGLGTVSEGDFSKIPWQEGPFFVETQVDPDGSENYSILAVSQLLSVPYALHSKTAEKLAGSVGEYAKKAAIVRFEASRDVQKEDISNTIECTSSATLKLTPDFDMEIGSTINLEAHNGAVLTILAAAGVTINYTPQGKATFNSASNNVRFGILRKINVNSFIVSGQ